MVELQANLGLTMNSNFVVYVYSFQSQYYGNEIDKLEDLDYFSLNLPFYGQLSTELIFLLLKESHSLSNESFWPIHCFSLEFDWRKMYYINHSQFIHRVFFNWHTSAIIG